MGCVIKWVNVLKMCNKMGKCPFKMCNKMSSTHGGWRGNISRSTVTVPPCCGGGVPLLGADLLMVVDLFCKSEPLGLTKN